MPDAPCRPDDGDRGEDDARGRRRPRRRGSRRAPPAATATAARRAAARRARSPTKPIASAAPVNAPKSWWPRNETSRWPGRGPSEVVDDRRGTWSTPQTRGRQRPGDEDDRKRSTSTRRRKSSTTAGASSAYSIELRRRDRGAFVGARAGARSTRPRTAPSSAPIERPRATRVRGKRLASRRGRPRRRRGDATTAIARSEP